MNIGTNTHSIRSRPLAAPEKNGTNVATAVSGEAEVPQESTTLGSRYSEFGWGDLGNGFAGAAVEGSIVGAGGAFAGITKTPKIAIEAVKGVWKSEMLGNILKSTITPVVVAAGVLAPVVTTLGAVGYGLVDGFVRGAEHGVGATVDHGVETAKKINADITDGIVEQIRDLAEKKPQTPDEVLEIEPAQAAEGLASGVVSAGMEGVGAGVITGLSLPELYAKGTKELWNSDSSLPLKVGAQAIGTGVAALAIPFAAVCGTLYGLGTGTKVGYTEGFGAATDRAYNDMVKYHGIIREAVNH